MSNLPALFNATPAGLDRVRAFERAVAQLPQTDIRTHHVIHAGVYARTITIPAGVALTGALIKIATTLVVNGKVDLFTGDSAVHLDGYYVLPASAGRKSAFYAHEDTTLTMLFATRATTVEQAEAEFTDDTELLFSRRGVNDVVITGE